MKNIMKTEEKPRIEKIMNFLNTLDPKSQEVFENVMVGFYLAQNLNLIGSKVTKDEKTKS